MRLIKLALISAAFLFLIALAMSLLIPSHIRISRAANFYGPATSVLGPIRDTARWKQWHPAYMPDSGRVYPQAEIKLLRQTDSLLVMRISQASRSIDNGWQVYSFQGADSVTLQWYMDFELKWYPWEKFSSLFFEGSFGKMMEEGLHNLKKQQSAQTGQ
ncbi:MAG TPA: hypothetical protein VFR58_01980 [Flavisolibacter sp.]|nr:hypothetical protein [Flavisolibacter sp.]